MPIRVVCLALLVSLCACKPPEGGHTKVFIGAVLIDGAGGPPVSDSVVVVEGGRIVAAGARSTVPIPAEADKVDGSGKVLVPAFLDIAGHGDPIQPATAEEAESKVGQLAAAKSGPIHIGKLAPPLAEALLAKARSLGVPVIGHVSTEADAKMLVADGVAGFIGMIRDRDVDPDFAARLRDLRVFFAPALSGTGEGKDMARRNTLKLFQAGVPFALASSGGDLLAEAEQLSNAGLPALDVIVAGTRNGAIALGKLDEIGTIQPGKRANVLLLSGNPGENIRNLREVALRMVDGEWIR